MTASELKDLLSQPLINKKEAPIKYVIYTRKSTNKEDNQKFSIKDQVAKCEEFAKENNLYYNKSEIIEDKKSARHPDTRTKFNKMLVALENGRYQGIIAWHPDRLARNMKEAGTLIDMLDNKIIKQLRFPSFSFSNDDAGTMVLGITFVMAKQYSDQLKTNIERGNKARTEEGKVLARFILGYKKTPDLYLLPDGKNFSLIKSAWEMKLQGKTNKVIAEYLNDNNLQYQYNKFNSKTNQSRLTRISFKATEKNLTKSIFSKPHYAGVIVHGENMAIIDEVSPIGFDPMITPDEYTKINKVYPGQKIVQRKSSKRTILLEDKVICNTCNETRTIQVTPKKIKG